MPIVSQYYGIIVKIDLRALWKEIKNSGEYFKIEPH